jgi:hypothetical protein
MVGMGKNPDQVASQFMDVIADGKRKFFYVFRSLL